MSVADHKPGTVLRTLWIALCLAWSSLTGFAFYERYWRVRDCFNELGRCWDEVNQEVLLEQAGIIWGSAAVLGVVLALPALVGLLRPRKS